MVKDVIVNGKTRGARAPNLESANEIWIASHDEALQFDSEHVRVLTRLATFMAAPLQLLRLTHHATRDSAERAREQTNRHKGTIAAASLGPAATRQEIPPVSSRTESGDVAVAFRALLEQLRLVVRDSRRLVRRLIAACETSKHASSAATSSPPPLASVPLVVLRSTTEREQIELNDLALNLSAEGYQVARRGPQWVVYTEIADRRKSATATSELVSSRPLPHRRKEDDGIACAPSSPAGLVIAGDTSRRPMFW